MRSFVIWQGDAFVNKVIVFLHGVGEGFFPMTAQEDPKKSRDVAQRVGLQNVFNHGLPRLLGSPQAAGASFAHAYGVPPYLHEFLVVIPQVALREDMAAIEVTRPLLESVHAIAGGLCSEPRLGLLGFSRGGFAAVQLAADAKVGAKVGAIVTMDAAVPMGADQGGAVKEFQALVGTLEQPRWMLYADHVDKDFRERITLPNDGTALTPVPMGSVPDRHGKTKLPPAKPRDRSLSHAEVCNWTCQQPSVYAWLSKSL